jgi:hypothetical protein
MRYCGEEVMQAHIVCCNDSTEFVVLGGEKKANDKLKSLRKEHYEKNKWSFPDFKEYKQRCYWHLHDVEAE